MEQLKPDNWSLGDRHSSITSFFKLPLTDGHSADIDKGPILTGNCGLGWCFASSATKGDSRLQLKDQIRTLQKTIYDISFAPYQVIATDLQHLSVTITVENLSLEANGTSTISLPTSLRSVPLASYISTGDFTGDATVAINVEFQSSFSLSCTTEPPMPKLQQALCDSLTGHELSNMKFCLFTRRASQNLVTRPQIMFANSSLLRGYCGRLDKLSHATEDTVTSHDLADMTHAVYEYDSDSDLDSDSEDADGGDHKIGLTSSAKVTKQAMEATTQNKPLLGENERAVLISDTAFTTWKSLVFYLYTREMHFRPLTSSTANHVLKSDMSDKPATCSPKSMYRLACNIGFPELQVLALNAIIRDLSEDNIVEELFSRFTSMYPEVQKVEVEFLMTHLTPTVFENFLQKVKAVVGGGLPHCSDVVVAVMRKMNHSRSDTRETSRAASPTERKISFSEENYGVKDIDEPVSPGTFQWGAPAATPIDFSPPAVSSTKKGFRRK